MASAKPAVYLRWGGARNRADDLAPHLGTELVAFRWQSRNPILAAIRYVIQFFHTLLWLLRHRPRVVISQHTQPFCSLAAATYSALAGTRFATDVHNGPFVQKLWRTRPMDLLNRSIFRRAAINMVHNHGILRQVKDELGMPGEFVVVRTKIPDYSPSPPPELSHPCVMAICSFAEDEPVKAIFNAAAETPEVHYYVTGRPAKLGSALRSQTSPNVTLTGFLSNDDFDAMLCNVTVAMALSTWPNILLKACHESIGAGTPFITTDAPVARQYLKWGTVFVDNDARSIAEGVRHAVDWHERLREEMVRLKELRRAEWRDMVAHVRRVLGTDPQ